ncbi:MAG: hypothetical protein CM15mV59_1190 [Caudoviricetes sp.]|nr:MAG: hypothetical protein CM15mV59_1190 [Caudoviricetes sp.]
MDLDDQFKLEHLIFTERKCRICGVVKNLTTDFYVSRKNRTLLSSYSYECKDVRRQESNQKRQIIFWQYPDW